MLEETAAPLYGHRWKWDAYCRFESKWDIHFFYSTVQTFAHLLPDHMSWETGVLIEPLACVLHNFKEANVTAEDKVLILGSGPMGLLSQIVSKSKAALTVATEINPYRLAFAREISDYALTPSQLHEATVGRDLLGT